MAREVRKAVSPSEPAAQIDAVLNRAQRRHIVGAIAETLVHDGSVDHRPRMHRGIHAQLLHALELWGIDLVDVGKDPGLSDGSTSYGK